MSERATIPNPTPSAMPPEANPAPAAGTENNGAPAPSTPPERPEWLPEKFKDAEQMAAAYAELEKKLSGGDTTDPDPNAAGEGGDKDGAGGGKDAADEKAGGDEEVSYGKAVDIALEAAGLTPKGIWQEYQDNEGKLTDETYAKLEEAGYPRAMVDAYQRGLAGESADSQVASDAEIKAIKDSVGGEEAFNQMVEWAKTGLSAEDLATYNKIVSEGDPATAKMAVEALHGWYTAAEGKDPSLIQSGGRPGMDVFKSAQAAVDAMAEARRSKDPAKIKEVEQKMLRSNVFLGGVSQ